MVQVRINGQDSAINGAELPRVTDLIELVKGAIDPDHVISSLRMDGKDLMENQWEVAPAQFGTAILEVSTVTPSEFVRERLEIIPGILENTYILFRSARQEFQSGRSEQGNKILVTAVNDLRAFFDWYVPLLGMVPEDRRSEFLIEKNANQIGEICKEICEQQLYQSWWALATTIQEKLEPALDELENFFRRHVSEQ